MLFNVISLYDLNDIYIIGSHDIKKKSSYPLIENFNIISETILLKSLYYRDLIVLDELGFLEEGSELFKETIYKILDSNKPVLGVLKECNTDFINKIKSRNDVYVVKIDEDNRNLMKDEILELLQNINDDKTYSNKVF
ncbi:nucleoside-triphosphatase [Clostridium sp. OS1-26]|uniref:nucleoside-triphosphatase n=1 Tax=Clostridium sp. OS1-26 TaxID=3070681 RepID=UPI0027E05826|nr:nucleoside-triphosphatase [Clostridium sp. OS1-26]WML37793.1 nucleoside-triphosphatase [Clostridium sp. OS1-26]